MSNRFQAAVAEMHELMSKHAHFGALDTEPIMEFSTVLYDHLDGRVVRVPTTARGWAAVP